MNYREVDPLAYLRRDSVEDLRSGQRSSVDCSLKDFLPNGVEPIGS